MLEISKTAQLDLNKNKLIVDTSGELLEDIRSPIWDESWSPLWAKPDNHYDSEEYDKDGHHYYIDNGSLKMDGVTLASDLQPGFTKELMDNSLALLSYDVNGNWSLSESLQIMKDGAQVYQFEPLGTVVHSRIRELNSCCATVIVYSSSSGKHIRYLRLSSSGAVLAEGDWAWAGKVSRAAASSWSSPSSSLDLTDPLIWMGYNSASDAYGFTVFNTKGHSINPWDSLAFQTFIDHDGLVTDSITWHTGTETAQEDVTETVSYSTAYSFSTGYTVKQAYKIDGTWYDWDTREQIEFDVGYTPIDSGTTQEIDGAEVVEIYNYNDYSYNYSWIVSGIPSGAVITASIGTVNDNTVSTTLHSNFSGTYDATSLLWQQQLAVSYRDESVDLPAASWSRTGYNGYPISHTYYYTQTVTVTNRGPATLFGDDGYLYGAVHSADNTTISSATVWSMRAEITRITTTSSAHTVNFSSTDYWKAPSNYRVFHGCSVSLAQGYIRWVGVFYGSNVSYTVLYDSALNDMAYYSGTQLDSSLLYDVNPLPFTSFGSISQISDNWRVLINSSVPVGVSYSQSPDSQGSLISEWGNLDTEWYISGNDSSVVMKENDKIYKVSTGAEVTLQLLFNRYLVMNTSSYLNCYDIKLGTLVHYALDWNNRAIPGYRKNSSLTDSKIKAVDQTNYYLWATGINSNYTNEPTGITSLSIGPTSYIYCDTGNINLIAASDGCWPVDIYYGKTSATYQFSMMNEVRTQKTRLLGLSFPISSGGSSYFTPNMFTEFIQSYNNKDMVKSGNYSYLLSYIYGTEPSLSWTTASQQEDVSVIFVIQGQFYGVINNKLYSLVYSGQTLVQAEAIIDITGLKFIGFVPTIAYFYSPMTQSLYSFTGDANLTLLKECTSWNEVNGTWFNTATQTLFIQVTTDDGPFLYVFSPSNTFRLELGTVKMWFLNRAETIVSTATSNFFLRYSPMEGYSPLKNRIATKLIGPGTAKWNNITKWHITLSKPSIQSGNGSIVLSDYKLTNIRTESDKVEKKLTEADWTNGVTEVVYIPKLSKGRGQGISVTTDYVIQSISAEVGIAGGITPQTVR